MGEKWQSKLYNNQQVVHRLQVVKVRYREARALSLVLCGTQECALPAHFWYLVMGEVLLYPQIWRYKICLDPELPFRIKLNVWSIDRLNQNNQQTRASFDCLDINNIHSHTLKGNINNNMLFSSHIVAPYDHNASYYLFWKNRLLCSV